MEATMWKDGHNSLWRLADHLKNLLESVEKDKLDFHLDFEVSVTGRRAQIRL